MKVVSIPTHKGFMKNYVYLCVNEITNESFVIDPSWQLDKIYDKISETSSKLKAIILTHSHFDHVNLVDEIVDKLDIPVYISKTEAEYYDFKCRNMVILDDNDLIEICGMKINTIVTPGHTKGSTCIYSDGTFFSGDTFLIEGCTVLDESGGSVSDLFKSLNFLFDFIPDDWLVYSGHANKTKPGLTMRELRKINNCASLKSQAELENLLNWRNALSNIR